MVAVPSPWKVMARTAPSPSKGWRTIRDGSVPSGTGGCLGLTSEFLGGGREPLCDRLLECFHLTASCNCFVIICGVR